MTQYPSEVQPAGALLHDLGMIKGRDKHEKKGAEIFRQKVTEAGIPLDKDSVDHRTMMKQKDP